jgi:hypothetical protein
VEILETMLTRNYEKDYTSYTIRGYSAGYRKALVNSIREALGDELTEYEQTDTKIGSFLQLTPTVAMIESIELVPILDLGEGYNYFRAHDVFKKAIVSYEMLMSAGLLARHSYNFRTPSYVGSATTLTLTPLAVEFVSACRGDHLPQGKRNGAGGDVETIPRSSV